MCKTLALLRRDHRAAGLRNESYDPPLRICDRAPPTPSGEKTRRFDRPDRAASSIALPSGPSIDLRTLLTAAAIDTLSSIDVQDKSREPLAPPAATLDAQKSGSAATHAGSG